MAGSGSSSEGEPEFQIAPMIDVLLVLLIFFMSIASTAVTRYDPSIRLPVAPAAAKKEDSQGELVFNLAWNALERASLVTFEEAPVNSAALPDLLAARLAANPRLRVLVRGDRDLPMRQVRVVVSAAAAAGAADITFAALAR